MEPTSPSAQNPGRMPTTNRRPEVILNPNSSSASMTAAVAPSGQMLLCQFFDANFNPTNVVAYTPVATQSVSVGGASGSFTLAYAGQTTAALPLGTPGSMPDGTSGTGTVQAALEALSTIGVGNVLVAGVSPYRVTLTGKLAGASSSLFSVNTSGLLPTAVATPMTAGTTAEIDQDASGANFSIIGSGWSKAQCVLGTGHQAVASGTGANSCQWTIPGLAVGNYQVWYSFPGGTAVTGGATTAPYSFYDGGTYRGKRLVDQTNSAGSVSLPGLANPSVVSQLIGTVYVSSGTLRVELSDAVQAADIGSTILANYISVLPTDPNAIVLIDDQVHNGQVAAFTGTWLPVSSEGWDNHDSQSDTPGSTSTWTFPGLVPGTYSVQVCYTSASNRTATATYAVFDGKAQVGSSVVVNQQNAAAGGLTKTDLNGNSFTFQSIGTFAISGTILTLVLTTGSSGYTVADAALVSLKTPGAYSEPVSSAVTVFSTGPPTISVNGGAPITLASAVWGVQVQPIPYMLFPLPAAVRATDVVTMTLSNNVIATVAGLVPGTTNLPATNLTGQHFVPSPPANKTLGVGYNLLLPGQGIVPFYSNSFKSLYGLNGNEPLTPDGYPTFSTAASVGYPIGASPTNPIDSRGYPSYPTSGVSTIVWDGACGGKPSISTVGGSVLRFVAENTGHATGNYIQFEVTNGPNSTTYTPTFSFVFFGLIDFADDADAGRTAATGTWTAQTGAGWNGTYRTNDKTATSTFTWTLGALPAGSWQVQPTWPLLPTNTKAATYSVSQNGTPLTSATYDQTTLAIRGNPADYNGSPINFAPAINFTATGGTITVTLSGGTDGFAVADCLWLEVVGSLSTPFTPITNARLYDPLVPNPLTSPPKFHPILMSTLAGVKCLRSLAPLNALGSSVVNYSDFATGTEFCSNLQGKARTYLITKAENWGDPNGFWGQTNAGQTAKLTLTPLNGAPLPFTTGMTLATSSEPTMIFPTTDGTTDFQGFLGIVEYDPTRMASNQIAVFGYGSTGKGAIVTTTPVAPATSLGSVIVNFSSIPPADYFQLVAAIPGCAAWVNVPKLANQACVTALMNAATAALPKGTPIYVEVGDEPWNSGNGFADYGYYQGLALTQSLVGGAMGAYTKVAGQVHAWCAAALVAGPWGSSASLRRVFNCQFTSTSTAGAVFAYANAHAIPVDRIAIAPYFSANPVNEPGLTAVYQSLDSAQIVDAIDAFQAYGLQQAGNLALNLQAIAAGGQGSKIVCYEGGLASAWLGGDGTAQLHQSLATHYHPRLNDIVQGHFTILQNAGCEIYNWYCLDQLPTNDGSAYQTQTYGVYDAYGMTAGKGDGSDGLYNNLNDIVGAPPGAPNLAKVVTTIGAAINAWNGVTLSNPKPTPTPIPQKKSPQRGFDRGEGRLKRS